MRYIYDTARELVQEHLAFQHTTLHNEWSNSGAPPWMYRRITLGGRRQLGFTTATIKLALEFWPTLIVVPKPVHVDHIARTMLQLADSSSQINTLGREISINGTRGRDFIVPIERLDLHLKAKSPVPKYILTIFDEVGLAEHQVTRNQFDELRLKLLEHSNLLVEFQ